MKKLKILCAVQFFVIILLVVLVVAPCLRLTPQEKLEAKLKRIVIPEIEFREASIHDVMDFLSKQSREEDGKEPDPTKRGVGVILYLSKPEEQVPTITMSVRYITLLDTVKAVSQVAGVEYSTANGVLSFQKPNKSDGQTTNSTHISE